MSYNNIYQSVARKIYFKHNPEKIDDVPGLFQKYKGREKELMENIIKKYNIPKQELKQYVIEHNKDISTNSNNSNFGIWIYIIYIIATALICILCIKYSESISQFILE